MRIAMLEPLGVNEEQIKALALPIIEAGHEFTACSARIDERTAMEMSCTERPSESSAREP